MADDSRAQLNELRADAALITAISGTNQDGTSYSGVKVKGTVTTAPAAGSTPASVASATTDVQGVAAQAGLRLVGWSARSNASGGNTAKTVIRHGTAITDPAIEFINLQDDQSDKAYYGPEGIACPNGIFIDRDGTNAVEITIFYRVAT